MRTEKKKTKKHQKQYLSKMVIFKRLKPLKKGQMEIIELKNSMTEPKKKSINRLEQAQETISELKDRLLDIIQSEE